MKIFLQVFSETLSVHFCARCEHNVKHNNLSPTWDSAYQWPGDSDDGGGYWPWDRRCCWRWGPWTRRGSTPSYWPCSSPDTTFIKSSSVDQGQRKSLEIQFTSVQCWFGALDIFIIFIHLSWHHCAAHSPRSAHRRLGGGGAGAQGSYPRPLQCTVCLISRDLGWYQAWPGCSLLTSAQWLSQLQTPGRPQWPAPQLLSSSLAWVSSPGSADSPQPGRRSLAPGSGPAHPGRVTGLRVEWRGRDVTIKRYQTAARLAWAAQAWLARRRLPIGWAVWSESDIRIQSKRRPGGQWQAAWPAAASSAGSLRAGTRELPLNWSIGWHIGQILEALLLPSESEYELI